MNLFQFTPAEALAQEMKNKIDDISLGDAAQFVIVMEGLWTCWGINFSIWKINKC